MCCTNELQVMFGTNSKTYTRALKIINDHINKRLDVMITTTVFFNRILPLLIHQVSMYTCIILCTTR